VFYIEKEAGDTRSSGIVVYFSV